MDVQSDLEKRSIRNTDAICTLLARSAEPALIVTRNLSFMWDSAVKEREPAQLSDAQSATQPSPTGRQDSPSQKKRKT
jgi:hypothetical protein